MKKSIVTITGLPGSGKSSTAKRVAEVLGYDHFSSGDLLRTIGQRSGLSVDQVNKAAETDPAFDEEVDQTIRHWGEGTNRVIDTRIAFHWIPESFKVLLKIDPRIAAERTFAQIQQEGRYAEKASSIDEVHANMLARIESECKRYKEKYNLDYRDESQFDLVIDTARHPLPDVVQMVVAGYKQWSTNTRG